MENINKEMKAAMEEAKTSAGTYVHKLAKPLIHEEKRYEKLTFDFASLTGRDSLAIEAELTAMGKAVITPEFSGEYLIRMAIRACDAPLGIDAFEKLPMADFNRIRSKARAFLLGSAL